MTRSDLLPPSERSPSLRLWADDQPPAPEPCPECGNWVRFGWEYHDCARFKEPHPLAGLVHEADPRKQREFLRSEAGSAALAAWCRRRRSLASGWDDPQGLAQLKSMSDGELSGMRMIRRLFRGEEVRAGADPARPWLGLVTAISRLRSMRDTDDALFDLLKGALNRASLPPGADGEA